MKEKENKERLWSFGGFSSFASSKVKAYVEKGPWHSLVLDCIPFLFRCAEASRVAISQRHKKFLLVSYRGRRPTNRLFSASGEFSAIFLFFLSVPQIWSAKPRYRPLSTFVRYTYFPYTAGNVIGNDWGIFPRLRLPCIYAVLASKKRRRVWEKYNAHFCCPPQGLVYHEKTSLIDATTFEWQKFSRKGPPESLFYPLIG